jgi:hypothetical protein
MSTTPPQTKTEEFYRHEADRLLSIISTTADEEAQAELLAIARRYQALAQRASSARWQIRPGMRQPDALHPKR